MPQSEGVPFGLGQFVSAVDLKPAVGDLIEIDRTLYAHWAVYVGDGRVVHVVGPNDEDIPTEWALVKMCPLIDVAGCSGVRVNNKYVRAKERAIKPLDKEQIVQRAVEKLNQKVEYNFLTRNAEFYATRWRYGQGWSDQVISRSVILDRAASTLGQLKVVQSGGTASLRDDK